MTGRRMTKKAKLKSAANGKKGQSKLNSRIASAARWKGKVGNADKAGTVVIEAWPSKKDGHIVNIDPVPPPFLRRDMRENRYGDGTGQRADYTVTPRRIKKTRARRRALIVKASRRANR